MKAQSFWPVNRMFLLKIVLPALLTMVLFIVSLYQIIIPRFESIIMDRKREMTKELINNAWHVADHFHSEAQQQRMTDEEARRRAIGQIRHLRYGDESKDYFWITDFTPVMIMHPFREELNGSDLSDFLDSRGKKLFVDMVTIVKREGEGFVDYTWQWKDDSTRIVPKLSYVRPYKPWGWVIGTGIYIEDVKAEIAGLESNIVTISIWITVATALLLLFMAVQNLRSERRRYLAESNLLEAKERYEALVEASTEGLLMVLDDGQVFCNRSLQSMLGYTEEESRALGLETMFPELTEDQIRGLSGHASPLELDHLHLETKLRTKSGMETAVLLTPSPVQFFGKQGLVIIVKDIRHHKQIVTELDESRERFLALTNRLSLAVFRTEVGGNMRFVEANAAASAMFGFGSEEEMQATGLRERADEQYHFDMLKRELDEHGFISNRIVRFRKIDDSALSLSLSVLMVRDEAGQLQYCDCLAEDVTDVQRAEKYTEHLLTDLQAPLMQLGQPITSFIREPRSCAMGEALGKVMRVMTRLGTDVMMVTREDGAVVGIIDGDAIQRHVLEASTLDVPVYEVMRAPVPMVRHSATVYDVLESYLEKGGEFFGVRDESGRIVGNVAIREVLTSGLRNQLFFLQRVQQAESVAELRQYREQLQLYVRLLIERGAGVETIAQATTMISDSIRKRIVQLAITEMGEPPAAFAMMAMGSEGRSEQTLATDQDNAIIYADVEEGADAAAKDYFLRLGTFVCDALDSVGYDYCKGEVMAKNPRWCTTLRSWKDNFRDWVTTANPQDLLEVNIFFDFRHVYGEETLTDDLRDYLRRVTSGNNAFFVYLTQNALKIKPPSWQFKAAELIDIKSAMLPLVDLARIYALRHKLPQSNTLERMRALLQKDVLSAAGARDMMYAYSFLMTLRYQHQARRLAGNAPPDNKLHTQELSETEKLMLKRVLSQIDDFQKKLSLDFRGTVQT
jgi:PAS domain S-box-containing protein